MSDPVLLDTCVLLWILSGDERVVGNSATLTLLNSSRRYFSPISVAEIEIKRSLGKLDIADEYLELMLSSGIEEIPFTASMAAQLRTIPSYHRDPFDRMLIAVATAARLKIVTGDRAFSLYSVDHVIV